MIRIAVPLSAAIGLFRRIIPALLQSPDARFAFQQNFPGNQTVRIVFPNEDGRFLIYIIFLFRKEKLPAKHKYRAKSVHSKMPDLLLYIACQILRPGFQPIAAIQALLQWPGRIGKRILLFFLYCFSRQMQRHFRLYCLPGG